MNEKIALDLLKNNNKLFFDLIERSKNNNIFAHSYLVNTPNNKQMNVASLYLAQQIFFHFNNQLIDLKEINNQANPNFIIVKKNENNNFIKEDIIKNINLLLYSSLTDNQCKIIILENIENASSLILNSILKFVEEPPKNVFIIMNTFNLSSILGTIKSRSQIININDFNKQDKKLLIQKFQIDSKYKNFIYFCDDIEVIKNIDETKFNKLINDLMNQKIDVKKTISIFLESIDKDNYYVQLMFLKAISNDIIFSDTMDKNVFDQTIELNKIFNGKKSFFLNLIFYIEEFFKNISNNANINLQKNNLILNVLNI